MSNTSVLGDARNYTLLWLSQQGIYINQRGTLVDKLKRTNQDIFDSLWLDYVTQVNAHNSVEKVKASNMRQMISKVPEKDMLKALNEHITSAKAIARNECRINLTCVSEDLSPIKSFIKAVRGFTSQADVDVLAHWVWMVKNKMAGETVRYHIMPIFYGKQGGGKTMAMNKLIGPINDYRLNLKMNQMTDDRYFFTMSENYVVCFDEMQGSSKTDIDCLKNQITTDFNDARRLGTNDVFKVPQSCSFIGATNRPVEEQIIDRTGMRRFWQINCSEKIDWDAINKIDYEALFRGVDENRKDGYLLNSAQEISEVQDSMTMEDELDTFLTDHEIFPGSSYFVPNDDLFQKYKHWCINNGIQYNSLNWLSRRVKNKGFAREIKLVDGKTSRGIMVSQQVDLWPNDNLVLGYFK